MEPDDPVTELIGLLRQDDPAVRDMAASLIWQRYFRDLLPQVAGAVRRCWVRYFPHHPAG